MDRPIAVGYVLIIAVVVIAMILLFNQVEDDCVAKGGQLVTYYRDMICVSSDGRILE